MTVSAVESFKVDVAVIGGGPAGSSVAARLARAGLQVAVFERERFPRFRIGESLLPHNLPILEELGVMPEMEARFIRKYAANFSDRWGARQCRYPFANAMAGDYPYAYEVERAEFDEMLLDNAERQGAKIYREWAVHEVLFAGDRAIGLRARPPGSTEDVIVRARMVVDASGRAAFLGSRLGYKKQVNLDSRTAFFAHFEGVARESGDREGDIQIVAFPHGWFWMIPFKGDTTSVGMVVRDQYLKQRGNSSDEFLLRTISDTPFVAERMRDARQKWPAEAIGNFSYVMDRYAGDGYVMLGDAGAFLDPVFSTGVFLTMKSAQVAADAILECHRTGDYSARRFRDYEDRIRGAQRIFFRFIRGWYDPAFLDLFFQPRDVLGLKKIITSVLAADLFNRRRRWLLMMGVRLMFGLAALHRLQLRVRRGRRSLIQQLPV